MLETIITGLVITIVGGLAVAFIPRWLNARRRVRIETSLEPGPTIREYGFTETSVNVTIKNESGNIVQIQDIRLMFCGDYGVKVLPEAPKPRSHPKLPARIEHDSVETWYFPAEKLAMLLQNYWSEGVPREKKVKLRPMATTTTGKIYKGSAFRFSLDYNSYWPM